MNRKYGCLMGLIPDPWKSQIKNFANSIPKHHIQTEDDGDPHVTIKYGFINTPAIVFSELLGYFTKFSPIKIKTKTLSLFKGNEDGDVLILEVESKELRFLNELVGSLFPCVDKYPVYKPHITIAYLNPNYSASYISSLCTFLNQDIEINEVEYSDADRVSTIVKLDEGKGSKTLSYLNGNLGGALVPPPEMAKKRKTDSPFRNRFVVFERDKLTKNLTFYMVKAADPPVSPAIPTQSSLDSGRVAKFEHPVGVPFQSKTNPNRWFVLKDAGGGKFKVVPSANPNHQVKKERDGKEVVDKIEPDKTDPGSLAKNIQDVMDAEKVPLQEIKDRVFNGLYMMPLKDITEIKKQFGVKASGKRVEFAKKVADRIIDKLVAEGKINEKDVKPAEDIQETKKEEVKIDPEIAKVLPEPIVEPELKKQLEEKEEEFDDFEDEDEDEEEYSKQDIKEMLDSTGASTMEEAIEIINKRIADVRREREGSRLQNTEEEKSDVEIFKDALNQPPEKIDEINKDTTARAIALLQKEMGRDGLIPMYALVDYWADSMEGGKDVKDSIRMQIESALEELTKDDLIDPVRSRDGRITSVMFSDESGLSTKNVKPLERKPKQQKQEEPVQEEPVQAVEEQKPQRTMEDVNREINEVEKQMIEAEDDDDTLNELTRKYEKLKNEQTALKQGQQKPPEQATTGQQPQEQPQESTLSSSSAGEPGGEIGNEPKKEEEGVPEKPKLSPEEFQKKTQELTEKHNRARLPSRKEKILDEIQRLTEEQSGTPVDRNEIIKKTKVPTVKKNVRSSTYTPDVAKQDREELLDDLIKGTAGEEAIDEYIKTISKMNALDVQKLGKELKIAGKLPKSKIIDTIRQQLRNQYEMNLKYPFQDDLQSEDTKEKEPTTQEPEKKDPQKTLDKWSADPNLSHPSSAEIEEWGYEVGQGHPQIKFEDGDIVEKVNLDDLANTPEEHKGKGKFALVSLGTDPEGGITFEGTSSGSGASKESTTQEPEVAQESTQSVPKNEGIEKVFHGSHEILDQLEPREIKNYNSLGSWFTSSPEVASQYYGNNVYSASKPTGNFLKGDEDFNRFFASDPELMRAAGLNKEADAIQKMKPDEKRLRELQKKIENSESLNSKEIKEYRLLEAAETAAKKAMLNPKYMQAFRAKLQQQGYEGVYWPASKIDGADHDVYLQFHDKPIPLSPHLIRKGEVPTQSQEPETPQEQKQKNDPYQTVEKWSEDPNLTYPSVREIKKFGYEIGQGHEQVDFENGDIIEKVNLDDLPNTPEHYKGKTALVALAKDPKGKLLLSGTTTGYSDKAKRESETTQESTQEPERKDSEATKEPKQKEGYNRVKEKEYQEHLKKVQENENRNKIENENAKKHNMSKEEYKKAVGEKLQKTVNDMDTYIRTTPDSLAAILQENNWKTYKETNNTQGWKGDRSELESDVMGVDASPIYGYLSPKDFKEVDVDDMVLPQLEVDKFTGPGVGDYGDAVVRLKPEVRDRTTVTFGDSLMENTGGAETVASPLDKVTADSIMMRENQDPLEIDNYQQHVFNHNHIEAQYHGGIKTQDIQDVLFRSQPSKQVTDTLDKMGIPWKVKDKQSVEQNIASLDSKTKEKLGISGLRHLGGKGKKVVVTPSGELKTYYQEITLAKEPNTQQKQNLDRLGISWRLEGQPEKPLKEQTPQELENLKRISIEKTKNRISRLNADIEEIQKIENKTEEDNWDLEYSLKEKNKAEQYLQKMTAPEQEQKQEAPKQSLKKKENLPVVKKNVRSNVSTADKVKEFYDNLTEGINDKYSIDDSVTDFMDEVSKMDVLRLKELRKKLGIKGQYKNKAKTLSEIEELANNKKNEFEKNQTK